MEISPELKGIIKRTSVDKHIEQEKQYSPCGCNWREDIERAQPQSCRERNNFDWILIRRRRRHHRTWSRYCTQNHILIHFLVFATVGKVSTRTQPTTSRYFTMKLEKLLGSRLIFALFFDGVNDNSLLFNTTEATEINELGAWMIQIFGLHAELSSIYLAGDGLYVAVPQGDMVFPSSLTSLESLGRHCSDFYYFW